MYNIVCALGMGVNHQLQNGFRGMARTVERPTSYLVVAFPSVVAQTALPPTPYGPRDQRRGCTVDRKNQSCVAADVKQQDTTYFFYYIATEFLHR